LLKLTATNTLIFFRASASFFAFGFSTEKNVVQHNKSIYGIFLVFIAHCNTNFVDARLIGYDAFKAFFKTTAEIPRLSREIK
jgi:hypothetical protein